MKLILDSIRGGAKAIALVAGPPIGEPAAWGLLVHFGGTGFLAGYLFTALFLGGALSRAQNEAGRLAPDQGDVVEKTKLTDSIQALADMSKGKAALEALGQTTADLATLDQVKEALQRRVRDARVASDITAVARAFKNAGMLVGAGG